MLAAQQNLPLPTGSAVFNAFAPANQMASPMPGVLIHYENNI